MKYFIASLCFIFCFDYSNDPDIVIAEIIYIEPYPFTPMIGDRALLFSQAAWIKEISSGDSLAVVFGYATNETDDIRKKYLLNKPYKFRLIKRYSPPTIEEKVEEEAEPEDSLARLILSLPEIDLIDSTERVISEHFWTVLSIEEI